MIANTVSFRKKITYGFGQLGAQIFRDSPTVLIPIFMATMLGVEPWIAGLVILVPKIWVIFCDPLMGSFSDKLRPRFGRWPFLAVGGLLSGLGYLLLFSIHSYPTPWIAAGTICLIYLLASTAFSAFSVPYLTLAAELSNDAHERTRILAYRMAFAVVGVVLGVGLAQPLVFYFGGGTGWKIMAIAFAGICTVSMITTAFGMRRIQSAVTTKRDQPQPSFFRKFQLAARNRPFLLLTSANFIVNIGQACSYAAVGLVFLYAIGNIQLLPLFMLTMSLAGLAVQPLWVRLSEQHGKLRIYVVSNLLWAAVTCSWFWVGAAGDSQIPVPFFGAISTEYALAMLRSLVIGLLNPGFVLLAISMLTDTINHAHKIEGSPDNGSFAGIWSASEKLAFAIGPTIVGAVISLYGFQTATDGLATQGADAIKGILLGYSFIPASLSLIGLLLLRGYTKAYGPDRA